MRCYTLVASAATILLMSGCSLFAGNDDSPAPLVQPETQPVPDQVVRPKLQSTRVAAALIRPTNPDERIRGLRGGRNDPFARLVSFVGPGGTASGAGPGGTASGAGPGGTASGAGPGGTASGAGPGGTASGGIFVTTKSATSTNRCGAPRGARSATSGTPGTSARSVSLPTLPVFPPPNQARGILVSGIASIGGIPRAVVTAPDERVSRTVRVGERLSNGNVLVKAIYPDRAEPIVILEEYGTEVPRSVGAAPLPAIQPPPPRTSSTIVPGTSGTPSAPGVAGAFGLVDGLALNRVGVSEAVSSGQPLVTGTICNNTNKVLRVAQITLQLEDRRNGAVINSLPVTFAAPYVLKPGQRAEFDERLKSTELGLRGRDKGQTITKLAGWS